MYQNVSKVSNEEVFRWFKVGENLLYSKYAFHLQVFYKPFSISFFAKLDESLVYLQWNVCVLKYTVGTIESPPRTVRTSKICNASNFDPW